MSEQDKPKNMIILGYVVAAVIGLVVIVLGIAQYFQITVRAEIRNKQLAPEAVALREQRSAETLKQNEYRYVSQKDGTVRLPLARAQELVLKEWDARPSAPVPQTPPPPPDQTPPAPAPAPAPAAAPDGGVK